MEDGRQHLWPHEHLLKPAHFPKVSMRLTTNPQQIFSPVSGLVWTCRPDAVCSQAPVSLPPRCIVPELASDFQHYFFFPLAALPGA